MKFSEQCIVYISIIIFQYFTRTWSYCNMIMLKGHWRTLSTGIWVKGTTLREELYSEMTQVPINQAPSYLGSSHRSTGVGIGNVHCSPISHIQSSRKSFLGTLVLLPSATSALATQLVTYKPRSKITTKATDSVPSTQLL